MKRTLITTLILLSLSIANICYSESYTIEIPDKYVPYLEGLASRKNMSAPEFIHYALKKVAIEAINEKYYEALEKATLDEKINKIETQ